MLSKRPVVMTPFLSVSTLMPHQLLRRSHFPKQRVSGSGWRAAINEESQDKAARRIFGRQKFAPAICTMRSIGEFTNQLSIADRRDSGLDICEVLILPARSLRLGFPEAVFIIWGERILFTANGSCCWHGERRCWGA